MGIKGDGEILKHKQDCNTVWKLEFDMYQYLADWNRDKNGDNNSSLSNFHFVNADSFWGALPELYDDNPHTFTHRTWFG